MVDSSKQYSFPMLSVYADQCDFEWWANVYGVSVYGILSLNARIKTWQDLLVLCDLVYSSGYHCSIHGIIEFHALPF